MLAVAITNKLTKMCEEEGAGRWLVVFGAFFVQFIVCGISYSLGIFHHVFKEVFDHDNFDTSWAGSIQLYTTAMTSVALRGFVKAFGCRISVMLGGLLSATGLALGMVVTDLYQVYLSYGLLTGVGFGLCITPSIMIVEQHFYKGRYTALSIVIGGVGAGVITFPLVIRLLLDKLAWRGTLWVLSAVALQICVCGALMRPPSKAKEIHLLPLLSCVPLRNIIFHGMCISNLFWSFGTTIIYMYIPSYAMQQNVEFPTSTFLVSCIGMSAFMSRMIFAFMGSHSTLDDMMGILCSVGLGIVVTAICPLLFDDFAGQIGYCVLFGFYNGYWTTFISQATRELLGPECIAMGNGYLSFMIALGTLIAGPAGALMVEEEKDFKYVFYLAGACLLWSALIMTVFKYQKCEPPREEPTNEQKVPLVDRVSSEKQEKGTITLNEQAVFVEAVATSV